MKASNKHGGLCSIMDMRTIYLDAFKETTGNGVSFILIKEFNRSLNMLLYSSKYLFYSFAPIFNNDFNFFRELLLISSGHKT